ncbi:hypothetical protein VaNZ11_012616 [Volvox africanus]|uniref:TFIIS N-terminal domain-containing protein n=1 Tax=Volvox africanus TaxID=51714 RepID=A0ABQ5SF32_9CHLO|nr:hypothetical protein VaNZ11_012616 [Volvox africanus]
MTATTDTVEVQNLVFSRWIEVKHKAEPHNYIEFFLVTDTGNEVLAISAEDHGNSHYVYHSTGAFAKYGTLNSKNRADTISWLEMIVKDSQIKVDSQLAAEVADAGKPTPDNPLGLYYTQHKVEKTANPDGTHTQRFFLLDQFGNWHLAVVGEERETRDGHYLYKATEEFSPRYPLSCHAQKDVIHWLEQRVTHNLPSSLASHRKHDGSGSVGTPVGVTGPAVSGPAASVPSGTSADAWGSGYPGLGAGGGYAAAATPTSGSDGPVGSDGSGPLPRANHEFKSVQQQQQQILGSIGSPVADGAVSGHNRMRQQPQQEALGAAYHGMQGDGVKQDAGEPQLATIQPAPGTTHASQSTPTLPPQHLPNCVGALAVQGTQRQAGDQAQTATLPPQQQQQLVSSGLQHFGTVPLQQQQQQDSHHHQHQLPVDPPGHTAAVGQSTGSASPLASLQQLQNEAAGPQQHEAAATPAALPLQQGMQAPSASTPQQQHFALPGTTLQQQGTQGCQPVLAAESQGLAQLLAGLAASMPGGAPSQLPNNCPPLQLQLPLPPQLQLQGSNMGPPMASPLQQPQLQASPQLQPLQQFMAPSLFQPPPPQQQQQQQLPFPAFDPQTQLQQQQQLQLLQQQLQQRQQELQQLLQSNAAALAANNVAVGQQLLVPGGPLPLPCSAPSPGVQAGNPGNGAHTSGGSGGMPQQPQAPQLLEQSATLTSSAQAGLGAAAVQVSTSCKDFGIGSALGTGALNGPAGNALPGSVLGAPFGQLAADTITLYGPASTVAGGGAGPSRMPGQAIVAGGCVGTVTAAMGLQGSNQQPQLQLLGQAEGVVGTPGGHLGAAVVAGCGGAYGGVDALAAGGVTPLTTPPSPMRLCTVYSVGGGDGVSPGAPSSSGHLPQPVGPVTVGQLMVPGSLPPGTRGTKEAGPGPTPGSGHHHGGRGGRGSSGKHKLAGVAEVAHRRKLARLAAAGEEAVRLAQGAYLAALRHQALSEAAQQEALRKTIASWVRGQISDDEVNVNGWHENLEQILHDANRTRTMSVPFLSNESLMEITRSSVEAITLAAAVSLTAPYDPTAASSAAPPLIAQQQLSLLRPVSTPLPAGVAVQMGAAPASLANGGEGECRAAADAASADQPSTSVVCHAEALAAVSSLKALLMGDLQAAVQVPAAHTRAPAPIHGSHALATSGLDVHNNETYGGTIQMDVDSKAGEAGQAGVSAVPGVLVDLRPTVSETNEPAGLVPTASTANAGSAAPDSNPGSGHQSANAAAPAPAAHAVSAAIPPQQLPAAMSPLASPMTSIDGAGLDPPPVQPDSTISGAPGPAALPELPPQPPHAPHQQPPLPPPQPPPVSLPMVPMRPAGPVGSTAVLACAGTAKSWSFSDPYMNKHGVRIALESLRELAALCPPVANMASSNLVDTVKKFEAHPHPSVSGLAKEILKRWRGSFIHRLRCMSDSRCYQDPVAALESKIQANEIVFPSLNELLGVPRGSGAAATAADGAATPMTGVMTLAALAPGPGYTPMTPTPTGVNNGFTSGSMPYPLPTTAAPLTTTTIGEAASLISLPPPPISFTIGGAPTLMPAATTPAAGGTSTDCVTPTGGLAATAAETPRGLFDASLTRASALVSTPQLFGRHGGPPASPGLTSPGLATTEMPAQSLQYPAAASSPMSSVVALPAPAVAVAATQQQVTMQTPGAEAARQLQAAPPRSPPPLRQSQLLSPGPAQLPMPSPRVQLMPPPPASPASVGPMSTTAPRQKALSRPGAALSTAQAPSAMPVVPQAPGVAAAPPASARIPLQPPPPSNSSSAFALPSHLLSASPLVAEATTADVAALLATSAQSLAAHMQTSVAAAAAGGGAGSSLSPSISPAQLSQLVTLASTVQVYASALKASDAAGAASAWQSLVQQLRQAQALSLCHGASALGGKLPQWPLSMNPQSSLTVTGVVSAAPPQAPQQLQIQSLQLPALVAAAPEKAVPTALAPVPVAAGENLASSAPHAAGESPRQAAATQPPVAAFVVTAIGPDSRGVVNAAGGEVVSGRSGAEGVNIVEVPLLCGAEAGLTDA